jgi:hypothetical protein
MSILLHITGKKECRSIKVISELAQISIPTAQYLLNKAIADGSVMRRKARGLGTRPVWAYYLTEKGSLIKGHLVRSKHFELTRKKNVWHDLHAQ